ncbi:MAG: hypothetical protein ABH846_02505 [Patescibacteria group bacterium]
MSYALVFRVPFERVNHPLKETARLLLWSASDSDGRRFTLVQMRLVEQIVLPMFLIGRPDEPERFAQAKKVLESISNGTWSQDRLKILPREVRSQMYDWLTDRGVDLALGRSYQSCEPEHLRSIIDVAEIVATVICLPGDFVRLPAR